MTEINKLESEARLLDVQIEEKGKQKNLLNQTLADAEADLLALGGDRKRLMNDWNTLVVAMNQRDAAYGQVMQELRFVSINSGKFVLKICVLETLRKRSER